MSTKPRGRSSRRPVMEALDRRLLLKTIYVDGGALLSGDGSAWGNPLASLQQALTLSAPGDEIRVADGSYKPTTDGDRNVSFQLRDGVALRGGYAGWGAADPNQRDVEAFATILTGELGAAGQFGDNSYHVITAAGVGASSVLDGFTITGGMAIGSGTAPGWFLGGGIYLIDASPTITDCTITANLATTGHGMYLAQGSAPLISRCRFIDNGTRQGGGDGGAIFNDVSSPTLIDCAFSGNAAYVGGGAMHNRASSPTITGCTFTGNWSRYGGSAMSNEGASAPVVSQCSFSGNICELSGTVRNGISTVSPRFVDCSFSDNTAYRGGAFDHNEGELTIERCTFTRNTGAYGAGAIWNFNGRLTVIDSRFIGNSTPADSLEGGGAVRIWSGPATFVNCAFVGNRASRGGAVADRAGATFRNCTFAANAAATGGAIDARGGSPATIVLNCIVWGNSAPTGSQIAETSGPAIVRHSAVQGGIAGTGNINVDPRFVRAPSPGADAAWGTLDDDAGDLRLQFPSPCIDAGNNTYVLATTTADISGAPRLFDFPGVNDPGAVVDMGAHELGLTLGLMRIAEGETLALPPGGHAFFIQQLEIGAGATLDVADNTLIFDYASVSPIGIWTGDAYDGISGRVKSGRITSASLAARSALGVAETRDALNLAGAQTRTFAGHVVDSTAVLLRFTWGGDANLDGKLNIDDYGRIDSMVGQSGSVWGWFNGDFNYDGKINIDDYGIIDSNIAQQDELL